MRSWACQRQRLAPWKHGILNNSSDDARDAISEQLAVWNHPLDTRRKDNNRLASQKWFTGERFATFINGSRGSPGGPIAIATLVMIVAKDMQLRGVQRGSGEAQEAEVDAPTPAGKRGSGRGRAPQALAVLPAGRGGRTGRGRGRGRGTFTDRRVGAPPLPPPSVVTVQHPDIALAQEAELERTPTRLERQCDPADLQIIRDLFGSRAQTLINILLSWDGFFNWYYPLQESIPFMCEMSLREERALDNMQTATDMKEIFERVSIRKTGSFLPHAATHKVTRDILTVGDVWATDLSPLELLNAETKRVAESSGSKRLELSSKGRKHAPVVSAEGPANLVSTRGYSSTVAISVLKHMLMQKELRQGDGLFKVPDSRRTERLMVTGRTKHLHVGVKLEKLAAIDDYDPEKDSCIKAFVRMCAEIAKSI